MLILIYYKLSIIRRPVILTVRRLLALWDSWGSPAFSNDARPAAPFTVKHSLWLVFLVYAMLPHPHSKEPAHPAHHLITMDMLQTDLRFCRCPWTWLAREFPLGDNLQRNAQWKMLGTSRQLRNCGFYLHFQWLPSILHTCSLSPTWASLIKTKPAKKSLLGVM